MSTTSSLPVRRSMLTVECSMFDPSSTPTPPASRVDPDRPSKPAGPTIDQLRARTWSDYQILRDEAIANGTHSTSRKYFCEGCRGWVDAIWWGSIDRRDYCRGCYERMFPPVLPQNVQRPTWDSLVEQMCAGIPPEAKE